MLQRHLSDLVSTALDEDVVPIVHVSSTCKLQDLLNQCIQRIAFSTLDSGYLEKELPDDIYGRIKQIRQSAFQDESENAIGDPEHEKRVLLFTDCISCGLQKNIFFKKKRHYTS